jgi:dynein heavy chain
VKSHLAHFALYDFLWKDDMYGNYSEFIQHDPASHTINKEVDRLLSIEKKVGRELFLFSAQCCPL